MDIATIAKKTPNLIDLSIGDPDLITDQSIIAAAFTDVKMDTQNTHGFWMAVPILFKLLSILSDPLWIDFLQRSSTGLSWCVTWHVSCLVRDLGSWR